MRGFSVLELLAALAVFAMLIILVNRITLDINKKNNVNQMADQIMSYEIVAIKYINNNYRELAEQTSLENESGFATDVIVPFSALTSYYAAGELPVLTNWQSPCLHISRNFTNSPGSTINSYKAYLIFGNVAGNAQTLSPRDAFMLAHTLGGNAGVLVPNGNSFVVSGINSNNQVYSYNWQFGAPCGFSGGAGSSGLLNYSLVIDLTRGNNYTMQYRTTTDRLAQNPLDDPSLKREGNLNDLTMHTNLYLDNVVVASSNAALQHNYRALDFGQIVGASESRIQLVSDATPGIATTSSILDVNNAGLSASYIAPLSHLVTPGDNCAESTLGRIAQERLSFMQGAGSQVQCTYNPIFCGGNGYCYVPTKTMAVLYSYATPQTIGTCPAGLLVDSPQPVGDIDNNVSCPALPGWNTQGIVAELTNCNSVGNNFLPAATLCSSYKTVCNYQNEYGNVQQQPIAALIALQCTNATTKFTVNNYVAPQ